MFLHICTQLERLKRESEDMERLYKDKVTRLEADRIELEEERSLQKTAAAEERVRYEEHVLQMRTKVKAEQVNDKQSQG